MPNILWQNGSHKVVKNDDGTISAWVDCDKIDWSQSAQAVLDATGRNQYTDSDVVAEMPKGKKLTGIVEVVFRNYGCYLSDQELAGKFTNHEPMISPFFQAKINEIFPELADKYPNGTNWKDKNGKRCYAAFGRWVGEPSWTCTATALGGMATGGSAASASLRPRHFGHWVLTLEPFDLCTFATRSTDPLLPRACRGSFFIHTNFDTIHSGSR